MTPKLFRYILVSEWPTYEAEGWHIVCIQPLRTSRDNLLVSKEEAIEY